MYAPIWAHTCATHTQVTRQAWVRRGRRCSRFDLLRSEPIGEARLDLLAYSAEDGEPLFLDPGGARGVLSLRCRSPP